MRITWEGIGPISAFDVQLLVDGEVVDQMARDLPGEARSLEWVVPYLPTEEAHIRVIGYDGCGRPMAQDESDGSFTISKERPIRVTVLHPDGSPFGDQVFQLGDRVRVSWKTEGRGVPARFKVALVEVSEGGRQIFPIADDLPGTQDSFEWTIAGVPRTDTARVLVEVTDQLGFSDCDDSDYYFKIH